VPEWSRGRGLVLAIVNLQSVTVGAIHDRFDDNVNDPASV
jgi:hypothetical protein